MSSDVMMTFPLAKWPRRPWWLSTVVHKWIGTCNVTKELTEGGCVSEMAVGQYRTSVKIAITNDVHYMSLFNSLFALGCD